MAHTFEIYKDRAGEYRVRFKYNSEVILSSEGYSSKQSALNLIETVKRNVLFAPVSPDDEPTLIDKLKSVEIPAANRTVKIDHNSKEYVEFKKAKDRLERKIKTGNDFGDLSTEDLEIAASEVYQIGLSVQDENVRPSHVYQSARSSLLWIAEKAGGAIIETLAIAMLVALASLVGITIT